ncbi:hypothetical protein ABBQ32_011760 [Trebouxia sp. C0010 RCD-2024]
MLATSFANMSLQSSVYGSFTCGHRLQQRQPLPVRAPAPFSVEAAHKKGGGSTKNGRDSNSKRRGVKVYGGQPIRAGGIIVRQLGTKFHPGVGVGLGNDYTLYALKEGIVSFKQSKYINSVSVVDVDMYEVPAGNQLKDGSRKMRRREKYTPRSQQRLAAAQVAAPVPV